MSPALAASARRRRARVGSELRHERGQRLRSARVADDDVVAVRNREPRDLAADVARADESDGPHEDTIAFIDAFRARQALGDASAVPEPTIEATH